MSNIRTHSLTHTHTVMNRHLPLQVENLTRQSSIPWTQSAIDGLCIILCNAFRFSMLIFFNIILILFPVMFEKYFF